MAYRAKVELLYSQPGSSIITRIIEPDENQSTERPINFVCNTTLTAELGGLKPDMISVSADMLETRQTARVLVHCIQDPKRTSLTPNYLITTQNETTIIIKPNPSKTDSDSPDHDFAITTNGNRLRITFTEVEQ